MIWRSIGKYDNLKISFHVNQDVEELFLNNHLIYNDVSAKWGRIQYTVLAGIRDESRPRKVMPSTWQQSDGSGAHHEPPLPSVGLSYSPNKIIIIINKA